MFIVLKFKDEHDKRKMQWYRVRFISIALQNMILRRCIDFFSSLYRIASKNKRVQWVTIFITGKAFSLKKADVLKLIDVDNFVNASLEAVAVENDELVGIPTFECGNFITQVWV